MSSDARSMRPTPDDGFHEIQLSGKQLVFLFMATTLVSIVIFLCGVLVGRGARIQPALASGLEEPYGAPGAEAPPPSAGEPVIDSSAPAAKPDPGQPTQVESGDFNYFAMLTAEQQAGEVPQPPAEEGAGPATPGDAPPPAESAAPPAAAAAAPASQAPPAAPAPAAAAPAGDALTIQVTALKERKEAERVAVRLKQRGYEAYVADPAPGSSMYRVRVGRFTDRAEADRVKNRLAREEKFKPWITR